jgi:multidrug efflux pump subunit AcrB
MNLTAFAVRQYRFTLVLFTGVAVLGVLSFLQVPRSEDPIIQPPVYSIIVVDSGATPEDLEKLVVRPLEDAIKELDDLEEIRSTVRSGLAVVTAEFRYGVDTDRKYDDVLRQLNAERSSLPATIQSIDVERVQTFNVAIVQFALVSPSAGYATLQDLAEDLRKQLETVDGVRRVEKDAYPEKQVRVTLDIDRIRELHIPLSRILNAVSADNANIPGGGIEAGARRFSLRTTALFEDLAEIRNVALTNGGTSVVRLGDVAEVEWDYAEAEYFGTFRGEPAVFVTVKPQEGRSVLPIREAIRPIVERFRASLPAAVRLETGFDQTKNIEARLTQLQRDFLLAFGLVLLTILPLGFRASLLVLVSIPLSLAIGFALLLYTGYTLNQLSIVGMVIALGLLVDDAVVVVENIARFRREGYSPIRAAIEATQQIALAVIGTTATLLLAFLPLLMLPGGAGEFIRSLPIAVVYTVLASLLISLTIVPFLASRMLGGRGVEQANFLLRALQWTIHHSYRPVLEIAMRHRVATLAVAFGLALASLGLVPVIGFSLFPKSGAPVFAIRINGDEGTSIARVAEIVQLLETRLRATPEVSWWTANVGRGNPQVYYNEIRQEQKANFGEIVVGLTVREEEEIAHVADSIRLATRSITGAQIIVKEFENGPPIDAPIEIRLFGEDLDRLSEVSRQVERLMLETPGTRDVDNPLRVRRTDLTVRIDKDRANLLGVSELDFGQAVRLGFAGLTATHYREPDGDEYPIQLVLPKDERATLASWPLIEVPTASGEYVPVDHVGELLFESNLAVIERHDRQRCVTLSSFVGAGFNTDRVTQALEAKLRAPGVIPEGFRIEFGGEAESRQESFAGINGAIVIAIFGILAVLILEFRSFRGTLIVASVIPFGLIGGLVGLWLTNYTLSFTACIGFVALIGIEIKNSILLVDFTDQLRRQGLDLDQAIQKAGELRFLPVVLTTFTALGALLPLILEGSSLYSPLAVVIAGGLISSLLFSRVVTPVMYSLLPPGEEKEEAGR